MTNPRHADPRPASEDRWRLDVRTFPRPPAWTERAACAGMDPDLFFPEKSDRFAVHARQIVVETCAECPVRQECLDYATDNGETWGTWAGHSFSSPNRPKRGAA